jgi:hypothetical protein
MNTLRAAKKKLKVRSERDTVHVCWWCLPDQNSPTDTKPENARADAFLRAELAGGAAPIVDLVARGQARGLSRSRLFRRARHLGITSRGGRGEPYVWVPPDGFGATTAHAGGGTPAQARSRRGPRILNQTLQIGKHCYDRLGKNVLRRIICREIQERFNRIMSESDVTTYARRYATNPEICKPWPPPR